jgi:hypothetical protein
MTRAFVVEDSLTVVPDGWSMVHLLRRGFDPRRQVLLEREEAVDPLPRSPIGPLVQSHAAIESYSANEAVVRASTAGPAYLVLSDAFYPGWRASIDGQEVPIERANYLFRAVRLPAGDHVVRFWFAPVSLFVGGLVTLLSSLAMAVMVLIAARGPSSRARRAAVLATIPFRLEPWTPGAAPARRTEETTCPPSASPPATSSKRRS